MKFNRVYIEITNICNLNCSFCSKDNQIKREMSLQEFDTIINQIRHYTNCIYLHVKGEPLLHSKLEKILDIIEFYKMKVKITTNGTLLKNKYKTLQNFSNIKQINISLHSENNQKNYFENVFKTADILSEKISIVYRIWLLENGKMDKLYTTIVDKIISYYHLDKSFKQKVLDEKNIKIKNNIYLDKDSKFIWPENENENKNQIGTCFGTRSHIAILVNGDVVPCCLDSQANLKMGNIFENSIEEILNSQIFKTIHEGFKNHQLISNICKNCNYREQKFK